MKRLPLLLLLALTGCVHDGADGAKTIAIVGARLEAGPGKPAIPYSLLIVEAGKFKAVGEQAEVPLPKDAEVVNGLDHTIRPLEEGAVIEAGQPASFIMRGARESRTMREGQWQR